MYILLAIKQFSTLGQGLEICLEYWNKTLSLIHSQRTAGTSTLSYFHSFTAQSVKKLLVIWTIIECAQYLSAPHLHLSFSESNTPHLSLFAFRGAVPVLILFRVLHAFHSRSLQRGLSTGSGQFIGGSVSIQFSKPYWKVNAY